MDEQITQVLGIVGISNKGEYSADAYYEKLNVVTYNGSSYSAKTDVHGVLPTNTDYWQLYAEKGDQGNTGEQGVSVESIEQTTTSSESEGTNVITATLSDGTTSTFNIKNGAKGEKGDTGNPGASPIAVSSTSAMTDTTRIYVNTTDGHWYWYNGTTWIDGGEYLADVNFDELSNKIDNITNKKIINYDKTKVIQRWINSDGVLKNINDINSYIFTVKQNTNYKMHISGYTNRFICGLGNSEDLDSQYISLERYIDGSPCICIDYEFNSGANTKFIVTYQYGSDLPEVQEMYLEENFGDNFYVNNIEAITDENLSEKLGLNRKMFTPKIIDNVILNYSGTVIEVGDGKSFLIKNKSGYNYKINISGYFNRFRIYGYTMLASTMPYIYNSGITSYATRELEKIVNTSNYDYYFVYIENGNDENFNITNLTVTEYDKDDEIVLEGFTIKKYNNIIENYSYISKETPTFISNYSSLITAYDSLLSNEYITKENLGNDSSGLPIYDYIITTGNYNGVVGQRTHDSEVQKEKILIVTGVHGYERTSINSTYYFVKDLLSNYALNPLLENYEIHIVPCVTPWGFNNNSRVNYNSVNINRNFNANWQQTPEGQDYSGASPADQVETQIIQNLISTLRPDYYIDYHNSAYVNEVSYIANPDNYIKNIYRNNVSNLVSYWINEESFNSDLIFLYTGSTQINGSSNKYAESISVNSTLLETSWNQNGTGKDSSLSIKTGSETLGNIILGIWNKEN